MIAGIGDYDTGDSALLSAKRFTGFMSESFDGMIGYLEWLKTARIRKGADKFLEQLDGIFSQMEKISIILESAAQPVGILEESEVEAIYGCDCDIMDLLSKTESIVKGLTGENAVPGEREIQELSSLLDTIEERLKARKGIIKSG